MKLLGAATLIVAPGNVMSFVAAVTLTGAVLALAYLAARRVITAPAVPALPANDPRI